MTSLVNGGRRPRTIGDVVAEARFTDHSVFREMTGIRSHCLEGFMAVSGWSCG